MNRESALKSVFPGQTEDKGTIYILKSRIQSLETENLALKKELYESKSQLNNVLNSSDQREEVRKLLQDRLENEIIDKINKKIDDYLKSRSIDLKNELEEQISQNLLLMKESHKLQMKEKDAIIASLMNKS